MVLGESKVALDKNVVPDKPRAFFPTFAEWAADGNIEQIFRGNSTTSINAFLELYTVPENHTLFITSAMVASFSDAVGASHAIVSMMILEGNSEVPLISGSFDHEAGNGGGVGNGSISFPMPVRVNAGGRVGLEKREGAVASGAMSGMIVGFLLSKKLAIR